MCVEKFRLRPLLLLFLIYLFFRVGFWIFMPIHIIAGIFSPFIDFLPSPYQRILAAPFSVFHAVHHLCCLRAWTSQRFSLDFETTRQLPPDFETTLRLPSVFFRPTQALLQCFSSNWAFASSSRYADGLALQLTPRSLHSAFSEASAGRGRSRRGTSDFCGARLFMTTLLSVVVKVRAWVCAARLFMTTLPSVVSKSPRVVL